MKAVLRYTDCLLDYKNVFRVLAEHDAKVLKTKLKPYSTYPEVTIRIEDINELNKLVHALNSKTTYGVVVVKVKSEAGLLERIKRIWE